MLSLSCWLEVVRLAFLSACFSKRIPSPRYSGPRFKSAHMGRNQRSGLQPKMRKKFLQKDCLKGDSS